MTLLTIRIEGGLLSSDFLESIHDQPGQKPADFGLDARRSLVDEVTAVWSDVRAYWEAFERRRARAKDGESLTSATREAWIIPLLEALGYRLTFQRKAAEVDGRTYALSHRAGDDEKGTPVHIVAFDQKLGERPPAGRGTMSPHALVQDYLNRSDDLWGIVTNGATLRLLRDSVYFSRPSYIEFDLQGMLDGERLDEFILFYRLAHRSRMAAAGEDSGRCLLESYHQAAVEQGGRIRDGLRKAVEGAIGTLANGFLSHPKNGDLRRAISNGGLSASGYYQQLLYLIYRLLFLMVAEERNLLTPSLPPYPLQGEGRGGGGDYYLDHYSITRLRRLAEAPLSGPQRFDDFYLSLRTLFQVLRDETQAPALGVPALNGELFDVGRTRYLEAAYLNNRDLLSAIRQLSYFTPEREQVRRRVNYGALDVEELGSVYESLLDEYPVILGIQQQGTPQAGGAHPVTLSPGHPVTFAFVQGTERKTTGSYYTARELVKETLDSALDPVIAERLQAAAKPTDHAVRPTQYAARNTPAAARQRALDTLLSLRVCDSACGSGHFLLASARRIGRALAQVATGEDEPSPEAVRHWTREAIIHCIYGVDKNPLAVDLCKVALWIEGHAPGKPLTFLDAHIKCGDSLVGVFDVKVLDNGIPDEAFDPVTGDDKAVARGLKRRNKEERGGQLGMVYQEKQAALDEAVRQWQAQLDSPEDTPTQVRQKQAAYGKLQGQEDAQRTACDLWTAAFFMPLTAENNAAGAIPTTAALQDYRHQPGAADPRVVAHARALAVRNQFFHWPLEFPHVFADGGFTVMLGNPPWDMLQLDPKEFFRFVLPHIAEAQNMAIRNRLLADLGKQDPTLYKLYQDEKRSTEARQNFVHSSGRFPKTSYGRINLMALFAELDRCLLSPRGRAGLVLPIGIATDAFTQYFFADAIDNQSIARLIGYENEDLIFPAVHHAFKFCILTVTGRDARVERVDFAFFCRRFSDAQQQTRHFTLSRDDFVLLNPNTRTSPIFRSREDAELTKGIHRRAPALVNELTGADPWGAKNVLMFMTNIDSKLFSTAPAEGSLPLYEAKMIWQFNHRFGSYAGRVDRGFTNLKPVVLERLQDPVWQPAPFYWVPAHEVTRRLGEWQRKWLVTYRQITNATNERTTIATVVPRYGTADALPALLTEQRTDFACGLVGNLNALCLDYVSRQKIGGLHMNYHQLKQLPILSPDSFDAHDLAFIAPRVLELVYTAWDMAPFAADLWADADEALRAKLEEQHKAWLEATGGHLWNPPDSAGGDDCPAPFAPAKWDEARRALLRAELDAYYARLYGLTRDELRYILDPKDVYGPDFPGETFRVLKEKEERAFGEYRTRRLVLAAWDRLGEELGPVVVRNYREELEDPKGFGNPSGPAQFTEPSPAYQVTVPPVPPAPPRFGAIQAPAPNARPVPAPRPEPDLFSESNSGRRGVPPQGRPAPTDPAPPQGDARPPAPQTRFQSPTPPRPAPAAPPLVVPVMPAPQGAYPARLAQVMALRKQTSPEAIGTLVAALGDPDANIRWLAALTLKDIGGQALKDALRAVIADPPSEMARDEAVKLLASRTE